jgi:hypothetical protein
MNIKKTNTQLTIILVLLFSCFFSYAGNQDNLLVKAIQLFDAERYPDAEQILKKLLEENPEHMMANYYYGACRTENKHYGSQEVLSLLKGSTGEAPLKTDYYLGVQYQAQNRWEDAIKHYQSYQNKTNFEEQNKLGISEKIQQCSDKINPFRSEEKPIETVSTDILPAAVPRENKIEEYNPIQIDTTEFALDYKDTIDAFANDSINDFELESLPPEISLPVKTEPIKFLVNGELTYLDTTNFRTKTGLELYLMSQSKQKQLDTTLKEADILRDNYASAKSYNEKQVLGEKILEAENNNYQLQQEIKDLLMHAKLAEIEYWEAAPLDEKNEFIEKLEKKQKGNQNFETNAEKKADSSFLISPNILTRTAAPAIIANEHTEDELIYKIQLGAYSRGLPSYKQKLFDKLSYIRKIENYTDENGVVVYTTGNLTNLDDALKMQNQLKQEGVEDAFVVPYFSEKRITLKEAKEIESER